MNIGKKLKLLLQNKKKYFNYLKNLTLKYPKKNDLLVYDIVGSEEVKRIIFPDREFTVLAVRGEWFSVHPILIIKFLYYVVIKKNRLRMSYDLAFISLVKPKLLITLIDNNHNFHKLAKYYKSEFVCIQNGFRSHNCAREFDEIPTLFCFGQRDIDLYKDHGVKLNAIFPVGSIRSSYFLKDIAPTLKNKPTYDICFISEYLFGMEKEDYEVTEEGVRLLYEWTFILSGYIKRYLEEKNLRMVIAGRQRLAESAGEKEFYKKYFGNHVEVFPSDKEYLNSYRLSYKSSLVISYCSTLGFEALSWGKKVLFFPHPDEKNLSVDYSKSRFFKTQIGTFEEFESKMNTLVFNLSEAQFEEEVAEDKEYFMSNHLDTYNIIKSYVDKILDN